MRGGMEGWEWAGWLLASVIKFLLTPSAMVVRGIEPLWVIGTTTLGACIGVAVFFFAGKSLLRIFDFRLLRKGGQRKVFTPARRRMVRFRERYGLWGLLALGVFLSVPISSLLAAKYHGRDARMPWALMGAFFVWSVILTGVSWSVRQAF